MSDETPQTAPSDDPGADEPGGAPEGDDPAVEPLPSSALGDPGPRQGWPVDGRVVLVLVVLAAVAVAVVVGRDRDGVRIVEAGSSQVDMVDDSDDAITWAAVVENTTDRVALQTEVSVSCPDDDVRYAPVVEVILPGQRMAVSGTATLGDRGLPCGPDQVEFEVAETGSWREVDEPDEVSVSDVRVGYGPDNQPVIAYRVRTEADRRTEYTVEAVFRDRSGRIIGGTGNDMNASLEPGQARTDHGRGPAPVPRLATVEVYAHPQGL